MGGNFVRYLKVDNMKDVISNYLNLKPLSEIEYIAIEEEYVRLKSLSPKKANGPMHVAIKNAISNTLMGHNVSEETRKKISVTVSKRNLEKVCGFSLGHAKKAGNIGGKSKSDKKISSTRKNQEKSLEKIRGSKWMINIITNDKKRVPPELIEKYISEGYIFGAKGRG